MLEPAFHWARSDESIGFTKAVFCSNCDHIKSSPAQTPTLQNPWVLVAEIDPDRAEFEHLKYPPFVLEMNKIDLKKLGAPWGDLRADGFISGKQVISKSLSGRGVDTKFALLPTTMNCTQTEPIQPVSFFA